MKRTIIFEEVVKTQHQAIVEIDDDDALDEILDNMPWIGSFDEGLEYLENEGVDVIQYNRDWFEDGDCCEVTDVYETNEDELD